jgi:hypothetical protein
MRLRCGSPLTLACLIALGLLLAAAAPAQQREAPADVGMKISDLGPGDVRKSDAQRALIGELARRRLGAELSGESLRDLEILQRLLDGRFVEREAVFEQQAMGVVLGDVMAAQLHLDWVVVDDRYGHSRALRFEKSKQLFFPVTMLSKRIKFDGHADVRAIYDEIANKVAKLPRSR